ALRDSDAVIRWGGEEFVLVMPYATAEQASKRMVAILHSGIMQRPDGQPLTWSGGIAQWPRDRADTWQELVKLADNRMYHAKKAGKAQICLE
nr:GGDEF domain-containing protein [Acidithiobacillus sp.]